MAEFKDRIDFKNASVLSFHTKSCTGEGNVRWGGAYSFTQGFNPLYTVNPYNATAANTATVLATLIKDLLEKKLI